MEQVRFSNLILENRNKLSLSAVSDVINFDEETIILTTDLGNLTIKGSNLHITSFDTQSGELRAEGEFIALVYTNSGKKEAFFKRVFK
ncbi:MAG: sporulation protein YabP [Acutalibacteraceae bacterium]|nr:sporulation protein YabP [Acutalibacteraceae bacterium]